jgi:thiol-disulfide isomerase/thioredoxin
VFGVLRPARLAGLLVAMIVVLTGCVADANDPNAAGGQQGYPDVARSVTLIPPAERQPVAEISGPDLDGTGTLSSKAYPGKVVVINVWGSWCPPCRKEASDLQAASAKTTDVAQFLGVTSRDLQTAAPRQFVRENKVTYPSIYDPSGQVLLPFSSVLPAIAIPSTLVLDREGRLAVRVLGPVSETTLVQMINDTANGK